MTRDDLRAMALGAASSVATAVLLAVAISLTYSYVYAVGQGDPRWVERGHAAAAQLQDLAPVIASVLLVAASAWSARRSASPPWRLGLALLVGGAGAGMAFANAFDEDLGWMNAGLVAVDAVCVAAGIALGRRARVEQRALARAQEAIRRARSLDEVVAAVAEVVRGDATVALLAVAGDRVELVASSSGASPGPIAIGSDRLEGIDEAGTLRQPAELGDDAPTWLTRGPSWWLPSSSDAGPLGSMVIVARQERALRRPETWRSLAAQVSLAWRNHQLVQEARRTALRRERERVSHEIHDTLAQDLISAVMYLETAQQQLADDREQARLTLERAQGILRDCVSSARDIVWSQWHGRQDGELAGTLRTLAERWSARSGLTARCEVVGSEAKLDPRVQALIVSAAREALNNVHKHADAGEVRLTLSYIDEVVALDVHDDGTGLPPEAATRADGSGFGLVALRAEASELGGELVLESAAREGTTLSLQLPTRPLSERGTA